MAHFTVAIQREFFLFLLDKNDILTFVITHKVKMNKENGIMFYQMVKWQKILLLMDINWMRKEIVLERTFYQVYGYNHWVG